MLKHIFLIVTYFSTLSLYAHEYKCAFALGFPPYQFVKDSTPHGIDIRFLEALSTGAKIELIALPWRDAVAHLEFNKVDCVLGMEMSEERKKLFHFGPVLYYRKIRIFVPANSPIQKIEDLESKIVANDRGSELFKKLKQNGIDKKIRLFDVETKSESFSLLMNNKVVAMMGPDAVVKELSVLNNFDVREIKNVGVDIPVSIAFKDPNHPLLKLVKTNFTSSDKAKLNSLLKNSN